MKRENYFEILRIFNLILFSVYGILRMNHSAGVPLRVFLLVAFIIGVFCIKEMLKGNKKLILTFVVSASCVPLVYRYKDAFILLFVLMILEIIDYFHPPWEMYLAAIIIPFILKVSNLYLIILITFYLLMIYIQHSRMIIYYINRISKDTEKEQALKKNLELKNKQTEMELKKNRLIAENQILEEKARISQTLHDKLGHNINGSIYQLEAIKLLIDNDPERTKKMTQAVIDQLRGGMDEIRGILRKEKPDKNQMALLQIYKLCEDCNSKGVETEFVKEGNLSDVNEKQWEIILDNAYEAVSNSMKYAKCSHINIKIIVMNKVIRCSISDDGVGCFEIKDGMGISGMRRRIREAGGNISFETQPGFTVNMILPVKETGGK